MFPCHGHEGFDIQGVFKCLAEEIVQRFALVTGK